MELKILATFNESHFFTGLTQVPKDAQLIDGQTNVLPNNEDENYFDGTEWIHKETPSPLQRLLMQQQAQIVNLQKKVN